MGRRGQELCTVKFDEERALTVAFGGSPLSRAEAWSCREGAVCRVEGGETVDTGEKCGGG